MKHLRLSIICALVVICTLALSPIILSQAASHVIYVDAGATGANDGTSWTDAYTTLQDALADGTLTAGDEIWVSAGTYYPDEGGSAVNDDRTSTFQLIDGVEIYGGFDGTETLRSQRDVAANVTILSGDIDQNDPDTFFNAYSVTTGITVDSTAVLDGFTITAGNANGSSPNNSGGGMRLSSASPTLANLIFSDNVSRSTGGGLYNFSGSPTLTNVVFSNNHDTASVGSGGGMYNASSNAVLTNVTFSGNSATRGGGMFATASSLTLTGVTFADNSADDKGGGIANENGGDPDLTNVTFSGNSANRGGGMHNSGTGTNPMLNNVTFSNNSATDSGGGMYTIGGNPSLTDVTFLSNTAVIGGGLRVWDGNPTLTGVTFTGNSASDNGGGMANRDSTLTLTDVTFTGNSASNDGGGMWTGGSPSLTDVTFTGNSATSGGGMYNAASSPILVDVTFSGNSADGGSGGGMFNSTSTPRMVNLIFSGNSATNGGGMYSSYGDPNLTNISFLGNAADAGGGMANQSSDPTLTNVTFYGNSASSSRGTSIDNLNGSSPLIQNSIIWANSDTDNGVNIFNGTSNPTIIDSIVQGGCPTTTTCTNVLTADPLFVDADGPDNIPGTADDDLRLRPGSPAINAGDNNADLDGSGAGTDTISSVATDVRGATRILGGTVDMGAYEAFANVIYVDASATGAADGTSWGDAYPTLQDGLANASPGSQIWVAAGTYTPGTQRGDTFGLVDNVEVYGGFVGTEASLTQRDPAANPTILSGEIGGAGPTDNSYHVVTAAGVGSSASLDGVTISGGNAAGSPTPQGGGLRVNNASPTLATITLANNNAEDGGGAAFLGTSAPNAAGVIAQNNGASLNGGAVYIGGSASPSLSGLEARGNNAGTSGGAVYIGGSGSPSLTALEARSNGATVNGGAVYIGGTGSASLSDLDAVGNNAGTNGGAVYIGGSGSPTLLNAKARGNGAGTSGGAVYIGSTPPLIDGLEASGNNAGTSGGAVYIGGTGAPLLNKLDGRSNSSPDGGAVYIGSGAPTFTNALLVGNEAGTNGGAVYIGGTGQATFTNATLVGNQEGVSGGAVYIGGTGTFANSIVSDSAVTVAGGAAEFTNAYLDGGCPAGATCGGPLVSSGLAFVAAPSAGADGDWLTTDDNDPGDLRPLYTSAVIDLGDNAAVPARISADAGDVNRIADGDDNGSAIVDLGAFEAQVVPDGTVLYVDADRSSTRPTGLSWGGAFTDLTDALALAPYAQGSLEVWVAAGTYTPGPSRLASFTLHDNISIFGGFVGGEADRSQRGGALTTLSGEIQGDDDPTNNAYHVVVAEGVGASAVLEGVTVTGGYAETTGGGLLLSAASPTLTNVALTGNYAAQGGGGAAILAGSDPTLTNLLAAENATGGAGGGLHVAASSPTLINATIAANTAASGGGLYNVDASPSIVNSLFWANDAASGPAMLNAGTTSADVTYTLLDASRVAGGGAWTPGGAGNITTGADPRLTNDFGLRAFSPALSAAASTALPAGVTTDLQGAPRVQGEGLDMGAYEFGQIFADVPSATQPAFFQQWIEAFYAAGITTGKGVCDDGSAPGPGQLYYCPEDFVTRADMAVFIIRALEYPGLPHTPTGTSPDPFADVPENLPAPFMEDWVEEFLTLGITQGKGQCDDGTTPAPGAAIYCPRDFVTRADMAVFILRALGIPEQNVSPDPFADVPVDLPAPFMEPFVETFFTEGITQGKGQCDDGTVPAPGQTIYCPRDNVTRGDMAVFILRAFDSIPNPNDP